VSIITRADTDTPTVAMTNTMRISERVRLAGAYSRRRTLLSTSAARVVKTTLK